LKNPARNGPAPGSDAYRYIESCILKLRASGPPAT
jgi:hypothetical protein